MTRSCHYGHRHRGEEHGSNGPPPGTVRVYTKAEPSYSLSIRDGSIILNDPYQHWYKDLRYSTMVNDEEGFPSFSLVNEVTGQAIKHSLGATNPVRLVPYNPDYFDESVLWSQSNDTGGGYRCIRMANNIRLNFDAFRGDKDHGGVRDGTTVVLWEWLKGDNQRWKIEPQSTAPPLPTNYIGGRPPQQTVSIFTKALKWWEKGLKPNMKEIDSVEDLVTSLLNSGDKLLVVDFFSPRCGGCKALHPKICQFAELNPDVQFLQVNYEQHKSMCYSLNVHVLPFFRFYQGAQGRLCSFSCTNATIKKFKGALAKHIIDRCSLGPARGLEESELLALGANKDLSFNYIRKPFHVPGEVAEDASASAKLSVPVDPGFTRESEDKTLAAVGRCDGIQ